MMNKVKNAIMVTGAAARISQEVACIDKLIEKHGLQINEEDTMLAGFSSGSLNLLALNACFRKNNPLSWDDYYKKEVLWKLTNDKVYVPRGVKIPLFDTTPLRGTLKSFLNAAGVNYLGDLAFRSYVTTFSDFPPKTQWAGNFGDSNQSNLVASDLFMASTAIPIAFPGQEIGVKENEPRNFPHGKFRDGGTGGQFKHFEDTIGVYVKKNGPLDSLNIVSPMREDSSEEIAKLKQGLHGQSLGALSHEELEKIAATMSFGAFMKFLEAILKWQDKHGKLARRIQVNIPKMSSNFKILDFNNEEEQYKAVCSWIDANPSDFAVPLDDFVSRHQSA